jgi:hypothetical protein
MTNFVMIAEPFQRLVGTKLVGVVDAALFGLRRYILHQRRSRDILDRDIPHQPSSFQDAEDDLFMSGATPSTPRTLPSKVALIQLNLSRKFLLGCTRFLGDFQAQLHEKLLHCIAAPRHISPHSTPTIQSRRPQLTFLISYRLPLWPLISCVITIS